MQASEDKKHGRGHVEISVCPTKISIRTEKKYKEKKMKEILAHICALQNSDGGVLALHYGKAPPKHHIVDCVRMIEQRVKDLTSCTTVASLTLDVGPQRLFIKVQKSNHPITISYNLHLPSECQVMALPPSEPIENIQQILHTPYNGDNEASMVRQSHEQRFVKGEDVGLRESKCVTLKNLKVIPSKCITLADRITGKSNKFTSYVSAFANHSGGRIYYGINDNGLVEGNEITEKDQSEVIKKVTSTINKMIWPSVKPQRGNQWNINFEPVTDCNGGVIPSTFVIVVSVAPCPGGVFSEAPESYHLVEDRVEKMSFENWLSHFTAERRSTPVPPSHASPSFTWSSDENRKVYRELTTRLGKLRNENKMAEFENLSDFAKVMFPKSDASLVVISEKIVAACQKLQIEKAEKLLDDYNELLKPSQQDRLIFEVKELYLKSRVESAKGNYEKSLAIAKDGLQRMERLHAEVITVLFYIHAAVISMAISWKKSDDLKERDVKKTELFLQLAERNMKSCAQEFQEETVSDLQQKLHISLAINRLEIPASDQEMRKNITAAESELDNVDGELLTLYRHIENLLAQCQLYCRRSDIAPDQVAQIEYLKKAYGYGTNARNLATRNNFEEIVHYANKCLADVTERIVRNWHRCRAF